MTTRSAIWMILMVVGSVISTGVTLNGIYQAYAIDLRQGPLLAGAYCLLPILCFPVFLLVRPAGRATFLLLILACGFLAVCSALNWRTCAELSYCVSATSTALQTLKTPSVLAFFGAAAIAFAAKTIDDRTRVPNPSNRLIVRTVIEHEPPPSHERPKSEP
jgi:hypothetical protein